MSILDQKPEEEDHRGLRIHICGNLLLSNEKTNTQRAKEICFKEGGVDVVGVGRRIKK